MCDVLVSEKNVEILHQICRSHYLISSDKIIILEQLIGLVLLGFVSIDELSREISENININDKHAGDIVGEIDQKIFAPIKADINKK